jgi:hypothetical protein
MGFVQIDYIDPLPGWQPRNPSAIDVLPLAGLAGTRSIVPYCARRIRPGPAPVQMSPMPAHQRRGCRGIGRRSGRLSAIIDDVIATLIAAPKRAAVRWSSTASPVIARRRRSVSSIAISKTVVANALTADRRSRKPKAQPGATSIVVRPFVHTLERLPRRLPTAGQRPMRAGEAPLARLNGAPRTISSAHQRTHPRGEGERTVVLDRLGGRIPNGIDHCAPRAAGRQ